MRMRIALIGAGGRIGGAIAAEARRCGHEVRALVRPSSAPPAPGLVRRVTDIFSEADLSEALQGQDALVSAWRPPETAPDLLVRLTHCMIAGARAARVKRVVTVGGAASLEVSPGLRLSQTPEFPQALQTKAAAHDDALAAFAQVRDLDWTVVAPAMHIAPGPRTGRYRTAAESLVVDGRGTSSISQEDFAEALVAELSARAYVRQLMTAGNAAE